MRVAADTLLELREDVELVFSKSIELKEAAYGFRRQVNLIPESCMMSKFVTPIVSKLTGAVDTATKSTETETNRLHTALKALPRNIDQLILLQGIVDTFMGIVPLVPAIIEVLGLIGVIVIGFLAYYSPDPEIAERAVRGLKKHGPRVFKILILFAALSAALYLHVALVVSRFCDNVDGNIVGFMDNYDFDRICYGVNESWDCNPTVAAYDIRSATSFYIAGEGTNALENITSTIISNVHTLSEVHNSTVWLEKMTNFACPAVSELDIDLVQNSMYSSINNISTLLSAAHLWPYYKTVAHEVYCEALPDQIWSLIFFNFLLGCIMLPVLAITLDVDLKRMVTYKSTHFQEFEDLDHQLHEPSDEEEEQYIEHKPRPVQSSGTYSHLTPTLNAPHGHHRFGGAGNRIGGGAGGAGFGTVDGRTFLA